MAEDLAVDVGIPKDSKEYTTFVKRIEKILKYGGSPKRTSDIVEKCKTSDLDIAKRVIDACGTKWWQEYVQTRRQAVRRPQTRTMHRSMSPMFEKRTMLQTHVMSPLFQKRPRYKRHRSPSPQSPRRYKRRRSPERSPEYGRGSDVPNWPKRRRERSPEYGRRSVRRPKRR